MLSMPHRREDRRMKVILNLPVDDIEFLDDYVRREGLESRSAALHRAVGVLRAAHLGGMYAAAWEEWSAGDGGELWASTSGDGIRPR
jgi:hypothetical protein